MRTRGLAAGVALVGLLVVATSGCTAQPDGLPTGPPVTRSLEPLVPTGSGAPTVTSAPAATSPAPAPSAGPSSVWHVAPTDDASAGEDPPDMDDLSWKPVAVGFGRAFTNTGVGYQKWLAALRPFVSARVLTEFSNPAILDSIPSYASFQDVEVVAYGDVQMVVDVRYDSSWFSQRLTLTRSGSGTGHDWLVSAVSSADGE